MKLFDSTASLLRTLIHAVVVASIVAGLIPPPLVASLVNNTLPVPVAEKVTESAQSLLPQPASAQAAALQAPQAVPAGKDVESAPVAPMAKELDAVAELPALAPLAQLVSPGPITGTITLTKTVIGSSRSNYSVTVTGPSYPSGQLFDIVSGANTITNLLAGVYTITETSPGAGWTTTYLVSGTQFTGSGVVTLTNPITTALVAPGEITGTVFADYDSNGVGVGTEPGVANVTVTAYDRNGNSVGNATTNVSGTYALTPTAFGPWRLEFTNLPDGYEPSRVYTGTQNGTSTQFVSAPSGNANLALNMPADYCQSNPLLCTSIYVNGTVSNPDALKTFTFNGTVGSDIASGAQVGSTWGQAWQRETKRLYSSAVLKRHVGLGPQGLGGIYVSDFAPVLPTTTNFIDLTAAPYNINLGSIGDNNARGLPNVATTPSQDPTAFAAVGKIGIGDIDLSEDGTQLWAVNLNNRSLIRLDVTAAVVPTAASEWTLNSLNAPTCSNGILRPWGLKIRGNTGYVGAVCDASLGGTSSNLVAYVLSFDTTNPTSLSTVVSFSLSFARNKVFTVTGVPAYDLLGTWNPWTDNIADFQTTASGYGVDGSLNAAHPQPILSDIEFDKSGSMILGFLDRAGMQLGYVNYGPTNTTFYNGMTAGDILRVCNVAGSFVVEGSVGCSANATGANNLGVNGGEYYPNELFSLFGQTHFETALGGLAQVPGDNPIVSTVFDLNFFNEAGLAWYDNATGASLRALTLVPNGDNASTGYFGKAGALGDIEALCDAAPIEIGNRVWNDLNNNGVQEPGEPALAGVEVSLQTISGTITTTTDIDGTYTFTREAETGDYSTTLRPNTDYTITIDPNQSVLNDYGLTQANTQAISGSTTSNDAILDTRDSDGLLVNSIPTLYYTTGGAGQNNHGLDFGFTSNPQAGANIVNTAPPSLRIVKEVLGGTSTASFPVTVYGPGGIVTSTTIVANTPILLENIPTGIYTVTEGTPPAAPSGYFWGAPAYTPSRGVVTVVGGALAQVKITNILAQSVAPTATLTLTKSVVGSTQSNYSITLRGPSYPSGQPFNIISGTNTITNLIPGVYTVTETSPGAGWTTTYRVGSLNSTSNAVVTLTNSITATLSGVSQITGMVYYDYNSDGQITDNGTINETGVPSVTVSAYNTAGSLVGSATTDVSGTYTITPSSVGPYRVEFSNVPNGFYPTTHGDQNGSSVQFVDEVAQATDVNFGINYPSDYCDNAPAFCMPAHHSTAGEALYWVDYTNGASAGIATTGDVGSLWGLAYQRSTDTLYAASFLRRNVDLGPNGLGAIYQRTTARAAGTNSLFFDVATVPGVNVGSFVTATRELILDPEAYDKTGKVGLGDIDISDDESTLWTVSLNDKKLLAIPTDNPTANNVQSYTIPDPGCRVGSGDYRPFATKYYRGKVYVGVVCDAEISQDRNDLSATIYRFDPSNPPAGFAIALSFPLTYTKGLAANYTPSSDQWHPWVGSAQGYPPPGAPGPNGQGTLPSPVLADIEFDVDGSMIIGFQDRFLEQASNVAVYPDNTVTPDLVTGGGDILRAYNNNGVFVLENDGTAGPVSGAIGNNQGPGGGEFYWGDEFRPPLSDVYRDTTLGGLALLPGSGEVVVGAWDPVGNFDVSGVKFLSNSNGAYKRGIDVFGTGREGKGGGVGDLELLCDSAPLEIGNRVWNDLNNNGVQEPGEAALAGVEVSLQTISGTITTTTDIDGTYSFTREAETGDYSSTLRPNTPYTITIDPNQSALSGYTLTQANTQAVSGIPTSNDAILDTRDSDAYLVSGLATLYYTTGGAGQNNHGLDFGFTSNPQAGANIVNTAPPSLQIVKEIVGGTSTASFPVTVYGPGGMVTNTTVVSGTPAVLENIAAGTYTVTEGTLPAAPTVYFWGAPAYTPSRGVVTVVGGALAQVKITNILAQSVAPTATLTLTKSVVGSTQSNYSITLRGPSYPSGQPFNIISGTNTITNLIPGVYTVTETSPGAGWTTTYMVGSLNSTSNAVVTLTNPITEATTAAGQITGIVYNDYNSNGVQDTTGTSPNLAVDGGVAGVIVTAYDRNGAVAGTATTDANGLYTLTTTASGLTGPYRLEFTNLPAGYEPSNSGSGNGNSTQFVSAPATDVNFGVLQPADYCQNNPTLCTNVYIAGNAETDTSAPLGTLQQMGYDGGPISTVATRNQVGSTWGLAYERQSQMLYSAAFLRRYVGLGNGGGASNPLGAIYATSIGSATTSLFIDISTLGASVGTIATDTGRGLSSPTTLSHDTEAFAKITKVGLGDMDISSDGSTLYVTSLNDKTIYAIDITSKALVGSYPFGDSIVTCTGGEFRPFALKMYQGKLYAGGVCDASVSKNRNDLTSFVYRLEGNTFNLQLTIPLTYTKGGALIDNAGVCGTQNVRWNAWDDSLNSLLTCNGDAAKFTAYPQPVLSDIEFDTDGSLILGYRDRTGDQMGVDNYGPDPNDVNLYRSVVGGDILRACRNAFGTFVLETNGECGGVTTGGANNNEGPGGGEYYAGDIFSPYHAEIGVGGLALIAGSGQLVSTVMDPVNWWSGGLRKFSNTTGETIAGYEFYADAGALGYMGKANGLGDVELLCDSAPLEIGNRVWNDVNGNGVQDPGENGMNTVQVNVQSPTSTFTVTTSIDGNWYFAAQPNTVYTITIDPNQSVLNDYGLTQANTQAISGIPTSNDAILDTRDSDGYLVSGLATIYYTTGGAGQNNHGLDFGFSKAPAPGAMTITNTAPIPVADPGAFAIHKAITTTDGSNPTVSGTFNVVVNCPGNVGYPFTLSLNANGTVVTQGNIVSGTVCSFSEDLLTLPTAPAGYTWVNAQISPSSLTIQTNITASVTATNWLAPLPPQPTAALTLTKTISGTGSGPFNLTINGPSGYLTTTMINGAQTKVITGLVSGIYTVTETSPGAGWTTTYTATTGYSTGGSAIVSLTNSITATTFAATQITGTVYSDYNSDGWITANGTISDTGVQSVTVTIYDNLGNVTSTVSSASGCYTITPSFAGPYRVVFTNLPSGYEPSRVYTGTQNGTTMQFINTAAQASGVNLGILAPCDYCQSNPLIAGSRLIFSDTTSYPAVVSILTNPYTTTQADNTKRPTEFSSVAYGQVGNTWGQTWKRDSKELFASAVSARGLSLGSGGAGAIYKISGMTTAGAHTASLFATIPNVGTVASNATRQLANMPKVLDTQMYTDTGRVGLGALTISDDMTTLYVTNLNERSIYPVNANTGVVGSPIALSDPGCGVSPYRPWALKQYRGDLYVGIVCENASNAYVVKLTGPSFASQTVVNTTSLSYTRQIVTDAGSCNNTSLSTWQAWTDSSPVPAVCYAVTNATVYPTPLLVGLEFADNGDLLLGFADRTAMQFGTYMPSPFLTANSPALYLNSGGDILRASKSGTSSWSAGSPTMYEIADNVYGGATLNHGESALGGLAVLPGRNEFQMTAFDPLDDSTPQNYDIFKTGGVKSIDQTTGSIKRRYFQHGSDYEVIANTTLESPYVFGSKGNGLGDVELLCDPAPIEIGNRVWNDLDGDGVQDAGEAGISGVIVSLQTVSGTVNTTTDINGNYYFTREATTGAYSTTLRPNTAYTLTINSSPAGYNLTTANATALSGASASSNHAISDVLDSDAVLISNVATVYYTTGSAGQNNHGLDFGFVKPASGQVDILNIAPLIQPAQFGDRVWIEAVGNGIIGSGETITPVIGMDIYANNGTNYYTATTNSQGYYSFTVPAGSYTVRYGSVPGSYGTVLPSTVVSGTSASGNAGSYQQPGNPDANHGQNTVVTVAAGEANWQVDFAFYTPTGPTVQRFGDRLWLESDNDGNVTTNFIAPVANHLITATNQAGLPFTTTTDSNGFYTFTVPAGTYTVTYGLPPAGYQPSNTPGGNVVTAASGGNDTSHNNSTVVTLNSGEAISTVDFAFNPIEVSIGNLVWEDGNDNGLYEVGEDLIDNLTMELWPDLDGDGVAEPMGDDGSTPLSTTVTVNGLYSFTHLSPGDYFVRIPTPPTYAPLSSIPSDAPDNGVDNDDNGSQPGGPNTQILSPVINLTPGEEAGTSGGGNYDYSVDFGLVDPSIGNLIWHDVDNDGLVNAGESGIPNVVIWLYQDADNNNSIDASEMITPFRSTTSNAQGLYSFSDIAAGQYQVVIPASNFAVGQPLEIYAASSTPTDVNDNQQDEDDNGVQAGVGVTVTGPIVTLIVDDEPINSGTETGRGNTMDDGDDNNGDLTIDFGFLAPIASLQISKTATPSVVRAGDLVTYTITLTNDGSGATSNVVVQDLLPTSVTYVSHSASVGSYVVGTGNWTIPLMPVGSETLTITVQVE